MRPQKSHELSREVGGDDERGATRVFMGKS